jgi:hypothetical protein
MKRTASEILADKLAKAPHTYMEMLAYGLSVSPWKRLVEYCDVRGWSIVKGEKKVKNHKKPLVTWRVVKG